ncbi:MAG TPA: VWA domain-containing protein [Blastocatellia bacterium]|nr:VWA domain-containing protein [Blastocatellia bacterium]
MDSIEKEVKKRLRKHLKGVASSTLESLAKRIGVLPYEGVLLTTDIGVALAANNLRAAVEFLKAAPEVSRLIEPGDMRVWGEAGKRLAATSVDTATEFFQASATILESIADEMRSPVLRLVNKQAALSANTAVNTFRSAPEIIRSIQDRENVAQVLTICLELARQSVKHSNDLFLAAPSVISQIEAIGGNDGAAIVKRALSLAAAFAYRSGGTAAEFFAELPHVTGSSSREALDELFTITEGYLDRSGGVALQYFKAASRVLMIAGKESFRRWTSLARRVALQGNAASYHFMKQSPQIVADLVARAGSNRRAEVVASVLEVVEEIAEKNTVAGTECFKASPLALSVASLGQFREWARRGIAPEGESPRRVQAYYALESKASQEALFRIEGGLTLDSVAHTLRLYVEGLTGRVLNIAPLTSIPDEVRIGDGRTIYLPSVVAEFEQEAENFRLFKVLAAHGAGQIEFQTYSQDAPETLAALTEAREAFGGRRQKARDAKRARASTSQLERQTGKAKSEMQGDGVDFIAVLSEFPNVDLALRLFTTIENGRIDFLLRSIYRGIRRDLDFVRARLIERRPRIEAIPQELVPFELLFQIAICGGATAETRTVYPRVVSDLERIVSDYVFREGASVGDSLMATRLIYDFFVERPSESDGDTANEGGAEAGDGEGDEASVADSNAERAGERQQMEVRDDPFSFWSSGQTQEVTADHDLFSQMHAAESAEQDLEKGDRAFYYDEWDRELGDYRTRWCRIIERSSARGSRGFVEMVRSRYAGILSSVRYQFQLLRPENLRRIRGEIDGEDYDLQAVIDYALDKRSTGLIDDRLYTRKLRRERDVAVSFLLDMSSSTARTISRYPNHPYTQPGQRIIDIEKEGLVLMSEALEAVGDTYSMQGFTSEGRRNVKFYVIKDFSESYSADVERRIGGISYQNNTRLGAAIRHAITRLAAQDARTKLLIVLSDGRPYDHDYGDSRYAREDTRIALRQARIEGITPFCITIDRESEDQLRDMYGEVGYTIIDDVLSLPERLPGIYSRLTT